jgi:hypothetical protein
MILGFAKVGIHKRQERVKTEEEEGGLYTITRVKKRGPHGPLNVA